MRYADCFKNHYCTQMLTPETITSAANPLLKDVRRAVAHGSLTAGGWCIAESLHLLEEALRSPCEVKAVLVAESKRSAVEAYGRRLAGAKVMVLPALADRSLPWKWIAAAITSPRCRRSTPRMVPSFSEASADPLSRRLHCNRSSWLPPTIGGGSAAIMPLGRARRPCHSYAWTAYL